MRIGIVGIGGVGGYFGGKLAREYENSNEHEIIFIARGEHLKAIKKNGLQLFTKEKDYITRPKIATDNPAEAGVFDLVFFCTKSYSLESSAQQFSYCINKNTVVIPLLNGVNSADRLRTVLPQTNVLGGSVYIISFIKEPGVVCQKDGTCKLTFGTDDTQSAKKYSYILDILLQAKIDAILTDKISEALWTKYLLMCPLGSLTASTGKTYGALWADVALRVKLRSMMEEVAAVAKAKNILLPENVVDKTMEMAGRFNIDAKTSMLLDREKGKQMEVDALTAYLCEAGKESGIPTPLHNEIYFQLIKCDRNLNHGHFTK
jgi:2-dehydropantoate 2-reductase